MIGMCSAGVSSDVIDALPSQLIYRQQAAAVPVFSWQTIDYNPSGLNNCFQAITIATTNHYVQMQSLYTCSVMRFLEILSAILNDIMLSKKVARNHLWAKIFKKIVCSFVVIIVPADGLAPLGARTSAGTMMTNYIHRASI